MPLSKLLLTPAQDGYAVGDADDAVLRAKVSAGPSRSRLDMLGAPLEVNATFQLDRGEYQYWRAFFYTTIGEGALPFLLDLLLDYPELTTHEVKIVPGSTRLAGQRGLLHVVQMRLEAKPLPRDLEADETLVWLVDEYGTPGMASYILDALEKLVNVDLPPIG